MLRQPAFASIQQLPDLVLTYPIMLFIVEHGNEHVQMRKQFLKANRRGDFDGVVRRSSPFRKLLVKHSTVGFHNVAEWLEELLQQVNSSTRGDNRKVRGEWNRRIGEALAFFTSSAHSGRKHLAQGDAQERVRSIGSIVDILLQLTAIAGRPATPSYQRDRIDFHEQSNGATLRRRFRVEDMSFAE